MKLSPQEAAALVREHVGQHLDPVEMYRIRYINEVCGHLGLDADYLNHVRVRHALEHCDVDTNHRQEYPKWVDVKDDDSEDGKRAVLVGSKAEHDALADRLEI
jgi:hypothetical protein